MHTNLLSLYRYPVYIFHEGNLDTKLQARIKKPFTHKLQMHFFAVELKAPASVKLNTLHAQARGWKARPSEWGYNHMIRFWVKLFYQHPAHEVQTLEYYMRLDTDSRIESKFGYDPFEAMQRKE